MRFVDLSTLPVTWNKIGTIPIIAPGLNSANPPYTCIVNGYYSIFYPIYTGNPAISQGAILFSFDGNGNMCTYQTSDYKSTNTNSLELALPWQIWQNKNTFLYTLPNSGGLYQFIVPPTFVAGMTFVLTPSLFPTNAPCTVGTEVYLKSISCTQQGYICNEFGQSGTNQNYWATIFNTKGGFSGGGFIGFSPTGSDLFDLRGINLPVSASTQNIYDRNGLTVYGNFSLALANQQAVGTMTNWLNGDPTKLVCGSPNPGINVTGINQQQIFYTRDYGMPAFLNQPMYTILGITDMTGYMLFPDNVGKMLSANYYIQLPTRAARTSSCYLLSKKQLINTNGFPSGFATNDVYMATLDLSSYSIWPIVTTQAHNTLTNFARPISVNGSYLT